MKITNKTSVTCVVLNHSLQPEATSDFPETAFSRLSVHSDVGSCQIVTEYSKRYFENYGKLKAREGKTKDKNGLKEILILETC